MMIQPLAEVFDELTDPRERKGKWHQLGPTLTMIFLAVLSGERGIRGVASWLDEQRWRLGRQFKLKNCRVPSYGTIRRVLACVDVVELEEGLSRWAVSAVSAYGLQNWPGIAIDGKTLRGSGDDEHPALHVLSAFSHALGVVLAQCAVDGKTNEIKAARELLEQLTVDGQLVTVDAMHTQRETAELIVKKTVLT